MKIGVSAFVWTAKMSSSHLKLLPMLREKGFDGFEIPLLDPRSIDASEYRRAFESSGLDCTVCVLLPQNVNPISPDKLARNQALSYLADCVAVSSEVGARLMGGPVFAPNGYLPGHTARDDEFQRAVECFQALGDTLQTHCVTLSIEPVNHSESCFLNTAAQAKLLCEAIDHPRIGVTVDTFHANIEEMDTVQAVQSLGRHLKHMHMSQADRGLLAAGVVDFPGILAALREIDYQGFLTIEGFGYSPEEPDSLGALTPDPKASPEDLALKGAAYLRNLMRQVDRENLHQSAEVCSGS